jgi:hypothetical protein
VIQASQAQIVLYVNVHPKTILWEGQVEAKDVCAQDVVPAISQLEVVAVSVDTTVSDAKAKQYCFNCTSLANKNGLKQDIYVYAWIKNTIKFQKAPKPLIDV